MEFPATTSTVIPGELRVCIQTGQDIGSWSENYFGAQSDLFLQAPLFFKDVHSPVI